MVLQDPQGRLPVLLIGAGIGAVGSVGGYLIGQWVRGQKPSLGGRATLSMLPYLVYTVEPLRTTASRSRGFQGYY